MAAPTAEEIEVILAGLRTALANRTKAEGASRIKVGDVEVEYDVREILRLIDYYESLLARTYNKSTIVKGLDIGNAF